MRINETNEAIESNLPGLFQGLFPQALKLGLISG